MTRAAPRIMVGRVWHESNGFNPEPTGAAEFQLRQGKAMLEDIASSGSTLAGIVGRLTKHGVEILPSLSLTAPPSGLVDHTFYVRIRNEIVEYARNYRPDAIALELHGAMGTTELADADGDLLTALRTAVGPEVPIAVGLDLHAHVTNQMLEATDICIACKQNPHADVVECGHNVADFVVAVLDGRLKPVTTMAKVPMILPGAAETASGPLAEVHAKARKIATANPAIWDISVFNVFRYADDDDIGQAVVILSHELPQALTAETLASEFWHERERYVDELVTVDEALELVAARVNTRPYVFADMGDRVLAGAPGDSVAILEAALRRNEGLKGAIPITDPKGAELLRRTGIGNRFTGKIGGRITPGFSPLEVSGEIVHVSDGDFTLAGPFQGGERSSLGPTAVLLLDDRLSLVVTTKPAFSHDPAVFTSQGVDIAKQDFVVVKSGYHFKLNFGAVATPLLVRTPGVGYYTKGLLHFKKARFWPEHQIADAAPHARVFDHALAAPVG